MRRNEEQGIGRPRRVGRSRSSLRLLLVFVLCTSCDGAELDPGPLNPPLAEAPTQNWSEFRETVGEPFTFAIVFVKNYGEEPAILDSVELVDKTAGIELVGQRAADITGDTHTWSSDEDFPPPRPRNQSVLRGFEIQPNGSQVVQVLLGIQLTRSGQHGFRSVAVKYHVGDEDYRYVYPSAVAACSQDFTPADECDARRLFTF